MKPIVVFVPMNSSENIQSIHAKIDKLYKAVVPDSLIQIKDFVAIKIHFGEKGNITHIPADYILPFTSNIKKSGGKPFLTDTNVLYKSSRSDAINHLMLAHEHGFTIDNCGAPVIMADGLRGSNEITVEIPGKIHNKVSIASECVLSHALIVLTHVTGHMATGLGGTIKNIGMGLSSRKGKLRQHSSVKPWIIESKCTGCEQCVVWCPEQAISLTNKIAHIDASKCIGCGECLTVCRYEAVGYNWQTSNIDLQKKLAEHALGAVINKKGKAAYFNFLINITKDCDCFGVVQKSIMPDLGIVASVDPVAVDQATLDLIKEKTGKSITQLSFPHIDESVQISHAVDIGLGMAEYELEILKV